MLICTHKGRVEPAGGVGALLEPARSVRILWFWLRVWASALIFEGLWGLG